MRWIPVGLVILCCCSDVVANPVPPPNKSSRKTNQEPPPEEVDAFAGQIFYVVTQVAARYVRPIDRKELLAAALTGLYDAAGMSTPPSLHAEIHKINSNDAIFQIIRRVRRQVGHSEALQGNKALLASGQAITRLLDSHSEFLTRAEIRRSNTTEQNFGAGLEVAENNGSGPLLIQTVLPGSPAQKAGLLPDDVITHLDGKEVKGMTSSQATTLINGGIQPVQAAGNFNPMIDPPRTPLRMTVKRKQTKAPIQITLTRQMFEVETVLGIRRTEDHDWDYFIDRKQKLAYVRISKLGRQTGDQMERVLGNLQSLGARGLLLDLRWCPGGYLPPSVDVAYLFLGERTLATITYRNQPEIRYSQHSAGTHVHPFRDLPLVVLINGETSGGAELIAAALQDHHRAVICGQRTRGKASIQEIDEYLLRYNTGIYFKLTVGTFVRPNGKNLNRFADRKTDTSSKRLVPAKGARNRHRSSDTWGVLPDPHQEFRTSPLLSSQLKHWWLLQTLRPGTCKEILPMDDLGNDPHLQAALQVLQVKTAKK